MAGFSDYLEANIVRWLFKHNLDGQATPATALGANGIAALWMSLHTAATDTGASENASSGGYTRGFSHGGAVGTGIPQDANDKSGAPAVDWTQSAANGSAWGVFNATQVDFPQASADWNTGTAFTVWGLFDAQTSGNFIFSGTITGTGVSVHSGNTLVFPVNSITITVD